MTDLDKGAGRTRDLPQSPAGHKPVVDAAAAHVAGVLSAPLDPLKEKAFLQDSLLEGQALLGVDAREILAKSIVQDSLTNLAKAVVSFGVDAAAAKARLLEIFRADGGVDAMRVVACFHKPFTGNFETFSAVVSTVLGVLRSERGAAACHNLYEISNLYGVSPSYHADPKRLAECAKLPLWDPDAISSLKACKGGWIGHPERRGAYDRLATSTKKKPDEYYTNPSEALAGMELLFGPDGENFQEVSAAIEGLALRSHPFACSVVREYCHAHYRVKNVKGEPVIKDLLDPADFVNLAIFRRLVGVLLGMGLAGRPLADFSKISGIPAAAKNDAKKMLRLLLIAKEIIGRGDRYESILEMLPPAVQSSRDDLPVHVAEDIDPVEADLRRLVAIPNDKNGLDKEDEAALARSEGFSIEEKLRLMSAKNQFVRAFVTTKIIDLDALEKIANIEKHETPCSALRNDNRFFAAAVTTALRNRENEIARLDAEGKISVDETGGYPRDDKNLAETFLSPRDQQVLRICKLVEANIPDEY